MVYLQAAEKMDEKENVLNERTLNKRQSMSRTSLINTEKTVPRNSPTERLDLRLK